MSTKVRIDLSAGILEAEGDEEFIRELYHDFRERVARTVAVSASKKAEPVAEAEAKTTGKRRQSSGERKVPSPKSVKARTPVLVKDLELVPKDGREGLKGFIKRYEKIKGSQEHNAVFVYYLSNVAELDAISLDHVYTCYKDVGVRPPDNLQQSLWDTARRKGTIDTKNLDDIKLTPRGSNWVEHDLKKAKTEP